MSTRTGHPRPAIRVTFAVSFGVGVLGHLDDSRGADLHPGPPSAAVVLAGRSGTFQRGAVRQSRRGHHGLVPDEQTSAAS